MIELKGIEKAFDRQPILHDFNYTFLNGKSYGIVGESGSGKTTLLNIIAKIEKPTSGEVMIDNVPLKTITEVDYFRNYSGYIFQNYGLIENRTIKENLELSFVGKKLTKKARVNLMEEALSQVNLDLDLNRKIFSLSGGESQRIAIAKIIIKNPLIILADEPTASLDEGNSREVLAMIKSLLTEKKILIIATHSSEVYQELDEVIHVEKLREGKK